MKDMECPYCHHEQDNYSDSRNPNEHYDHQCEECGKVFGFMIEYYPTYDTYETPCLNEGGEHDWQPIHGYPTEYFVNKRKCSFCNEETTLEQIQKKNQHEENV